jgi:isoquinoline 1-oxidoreductase alpha subunit
MHISVNGEDRVIGDDVDPKTPLLWVLRDHLGLVGSKYGCGIAQCGACTVHVDGKPVRSCQLTVDNVGNRPSPPSRHRQHAERRQDPGSMDRHRSAPMRLLPGGPDHVGDGAAQPHPSPDDTDIDAAMAGNICRCGTYIRIRQAIKNAAPNRSKREPMSGSARSIASA